MYSLLKLNIHSYPEIAMFLSETIGIHWSSSLKPSFEKGDRGVRNSGIALEKSRTVSCKMGCSDPVKCPLSQCAPSLSVPPLSRCPLSQGAPPLKVPTLSRCPLSQGAPSLKVPPLSRWPLSQGAPSLKVPPLSRCPLFQGAPSLNVPLFQGAPISRCPLSQGAPSLNVPPL